MKATHAALFALVAALGATAGFLAFRQSGHGRDAGATLVAVAPATPATPAPTPEAAASPATLAIPEEVPDLWLEDLAGKRHALRAPVRGPQLFNFWATWCEPCRREIPLLNTLQGAYRADGLQITGIAVDFRDSVRKFLATTTLRYALLVGEEDGLEAAQKFGMELALPFSVFADEQHRIIAVKVGELHREEADAILARMRELRAGRITLAQARAAIRESLKALALQRSKQSPAQ